MPEFLHCIRCKFSTLKSLRFLLALDDRMKRNSEYWQKMENLPQLARKKAAYCKSRRFLHLLYVLSCFVIEVIVSGAQKLQYWVKGCIPAYGLSSDPKQSFNTPRRRANYRRVSFKENSRMQTFFILSTTHSFPRSFQLGALWTMRDSKLLLKTFCRTSCSCCLLALYQKSHPYCKWN